MGSVTRVPVSPAVLGTRTGGGLELAVVTSPAVQTNKLKGCRVVTGHKMSSAGLLTHTHTRAFAHNVRLPHIHIYTFNDFSFSLYIGF